MKGRPNRPPDNERCQATTTGCDGGWSTSHRCPYRAVPGSDPRLCNVHRKVYERGATVFLCDNRMVQRSRVPKSRPEGA